MSIYRSSTGEQFIRELYGRQRQRLGMEFNSLYVPTRFGQTHVLTGGKEDGIPILIFHGGNSTNPHSLIYHVPLAEHFRLYAPDTMGHPGFSAQTVLSSSNTEYGQWASDVIDGLGFSQMVCMAGSFGSGALIRLMEYAPEKVTKSILIVPSGIANAPLGTVLLKLGVPMIKYRTKPSRERLIKAILPMVINADEIDDNNLEMVEATFRHVHVKAQMPANAHAAALSGCTAPTAVFAADKDVLFPGKKVLRRAKALIPNLAYAELMENCPHMYMLSSERLRHINEKVTEFILG